jgi:hypothetical protein
MRDADADEGTDRDDEPCDAPAFPIVVTLAGIAWIGFGALEWVAVVIMLGQAGANQREGVKRTTRVTTVHVGIDD